jgi:hypothetical protein
MERTGIVWGRVTRSGQPVSGAKVEVLTTGIGEPVYFNNLMLPDKKLTETSANGLFAMPSVARGVHAVQVHLGRKMSDPVFLSAENGTVASLDLDVMKASEIQGRAFEAFKPDLPVRVEVRPAGHIKKRKMVIENEEGSPIRLAHLGMPAVLDIDGGFEYVSTRTIQNPETRHLQLPMVQRTWYDRITGALRYNPAPQTGNIIGFIQGNRFRVTMDADALTANSRVVYFDSRGEVTSDKYGEPGGGFILYGVRDGIRTVVIESDGHGPAADRIFAATVLVEDGIIASLSHWLR